MSNSARRQQIRALAEKINQLAPSDTETVMVFALLCEGKTHREVAEKRGVTRSASMRMMNRLRKRALSHGINVPAPRRHYDTQTLAEMNRRCA